MHKFNLPLHRRHIFHKRIGINLHRKIWLITAAIILGLLIAAGEEYMLEHDLRLVREGEIMDLVAARLKPQFGAPGTVATDWIENTVQLEINQNQQRSKHPLRK